jgi:hypothetical protein
VLRIKHLLFVEGLTLAGVRRKLLEQSERPAPDSTLQDLDALFGSDARERILQVKRGLRDLATMLAKQPSDAGEPQSLFDIAPRPRRVAHTKRVKPPGKASSSKSAPSKAAKKKR